MDRYRVVKRSLFVSAAAVALVWLSSPRSAADDATAARSGTPVADRKPAGAAKPKAGQETKANAATQAPDIDVHAALLRGRRDGAKWVATAAGDRRLELTLLPDLQEK